VNHRATLFIQRFFRIVPNLEITSEPAERTALSAS
jgi:hypothetical protein